MSNSRVNEQITVLAAAVREFLKTHEASGARPSMLAFAVLHVVVDWYLRREKDRSKALSLILSVVSRTAERRLEERF